MRHPAAQTTERRINVNLIGANKLFYAFDSTLPTFDGAGDGAGDVGCDKTNAFCNITDNGANAVTVPPLILPTPKPPQQQEQQKEQAQEQVLMEKFNGKLPVIANELNCTIAELRIRLGRAEAATSPDIPGPALQTQHQIVEESTIIQKLLRLTRRISPTVTLLDVIQERRERCLLLLGGGGANVNGVVNDATATGGGGATESYALNFLSEAPTMPEILGIATVLPSTTTSTSSAGSGTHQSKKKKKKKADAGPAPPETPSSSDYDGDGDENYSSASSRRNLKRRLQRKEKRDKRMMLSEHGSGAAGAGGVASTTTTITTATTTGTGTTQAPPRRKSTPKPEYIDTWARGEYFSMLKPKMSKMVDRILHEQFHILPRPQVPTFAVCAEMEKLRLLVVDMVTKQRARGVTIGSFSAVGSVSDGGRDGGDDHAKPIVKINSPAVTSEATSSAIDSDDLVYDDEGQDDDQKEQLKDDQQQVTKEEGEKEQDPTPTPPKRRVGSRRR